MDFFELNAFTETPYVSVKENEKVKNLIFTKLGKVKSFTFESEDGSFPCPVQHFFEVLNNYRFQKNEIPKLKNEIWLADGDEFVVAKF